MKRCLVLTPYPLRQPGWGGQFRSASIVEGLAASGWQVAPVGIYHGGFFPPDQQGPDDIALTDPDVQKAMLDHNLFFDLLSARHAARNGDVVSRLRACLRRVEPDVVLLEQPWLWLVLRQVLDDAGGAAIVYSSHNIEWRFRPELYRLGLRRPSSEALVALTRALETELYHRADLVLSISDVEADEIAREGAREVIYLPPVSDLAGKPIATDGRFPAEAAAAGIRYAAMMGTAYWPNVEGFFEVFPDGLGFLRWNERLWVGGQLGDALAADRRYRDFQSINDSRLRRVGVVPGEDKANFLSGAHCVFVPVRLGAGAKLKTADALASGRAVVSTSHGIEGYGPLVASALGHGVYVADAPHEFRSLIRRALREGLPGCSEAVRAALGQERLTSTLGAAFDTMLQKRGSESTTETRIDNRVPD
ncbi:glycosyltransferase [Enhydrobacter sp.]|uniref:glycosyltransferase n=1 Tax=Enhydrobacter sp. TaxID=1894999 RepID=UPI002607D75E|nr:glycosyltransferase [Enhydrobacter sp.]WIM13754.1 MAG: hypothetical protein OJF58_004723 [Enhydrobacter sp.]